ncbi:MAG: hypothetical protein GVY07_07155 [Bacteroidetes bacterium]|jgi:hypothetical protein|nr:hypothetical protein [Bacteroidota bacterium]
MKTYLKMMVPVLIMMVGMDAVAQETEENVRMEYILCSLKDGFTFDDVIANAQEYGEKVEADGSQYNQWLMRPLIVGERLEGITHILVGEWPNGQEMYKEYGNYVNKYMDDDEDSPHTCRISFTTMDHIVVDASRENEPVDERFPVQLADCNLKDGVTIEHAVEVQKEIAEATIAEGMDGYGVHFQMPYLGFEDVEYDFMSVAWWQSYQHRGDMAQNYYKIANEHGQKMNAVASCENPRAYFAESIFRTWE